MALYFIQVPILLPVITGIYMLFRPFTDAKKRNIFVETMVLINSAITLIILFLSPSGTLELFALSDKLPMTLRIDGMAVFFGSIVACLWPLATLYTFEYMEHEERVNTFLAVYTITYGVTLGVAFSGNIVTLYLFYETLTMVTLPLVMHTMTDEARKATRKYLYYMIGGTAFAFIGMVYYALFSSSIEFSYGGNLDLSRIGGYTNVAYFVYILAFFGFGVKAAIFPFHGWLPEASVAPTPVTALLHAVAVVKSGVFAIMRFTYYCFGAEILKNSWAAEIAVVFAMITIVYASTMGVKEPHFKRRLAYSTVSNLSYILLALSMMSPLGLLAGMTHMLFHAVMKISGFFCVGAVMHKTGKNYVYELDGLGRKMPLTFTAFFISGLALAGFPLFSGFISKWKIAQALFTDNSLTGDVGVMVLLYSALMTAIYMISIVIRAVFPSKEFLSDPQNVSELENYKDPTIRMLLPLFIFSVVTVIFGIWSQPIIERLGIVANGGF
ncbi:MAG: proton-conducting membrane transporter [Butyrivibrio sp.]|nr:proton-conducting membrane transporter [Butyrivibrio sp.]